MSARLLTTPCRRRGAVVSLHFGADRMERPRYERNGVNFDRLGAERRLEENGGVRREAEQAMPPHLFRASGSRSKSTTPVQGLAGRCFSGN
jgi:hypothetical protein